MGCGSLLLRADPVTYQNLGAPMRCGAHARSISRVHCPCGEPSLIHHFLHLNGAIFPKNLENLVYFLLIISSLLDSKHLSLRDLSAQIFRGKHLLDDSSEFLLWYLRA